MKNLFLCSIFASFLLLSACGGAASKDGANENSENQKETITKPTPPKAEGKIRVLFVGNSHTEYYASFPKMLEVLAKENGKDVEVLSLLEMGVSIDKIIASNQRKADKLFTNTDADGNYLDYLILQESTPVAYQEEAKYTENAKNVHDMVVKNSPDVATYIYQLTFPEDVSDSDFKDDQQILSTNAVNVAKSLPNTGILPFTNALIAAYGGQDGYVAIKDNKDLLRYTDTSRHMLNDAVFLNSIVLYQYIFGETPKIPQQLPLATGTGDDDEIELMDVSKGVSNADALVKIAESFK